MPRSSEPQLKEPDLYEKLRDDGRSKVGKRGGKGEGYEERTVAELKERAKELGLSGYSDKRKSELIDMLRNH